MLVPRTGVNQMNRLNHFPSETFNARHLTSSQVAEAFIPPPQFEQLLNNSNSLLVGARGSGKTTLLKMLQIQALVKWMELNNKNELPVDFLGIFVPADVRWSKQLSIKTNGIESPAERATLYEAAFTGSICIALIDTLEQALKYSAFKTDEGYDIEFSRTREAELSKLLAQIWGISIDIPSLQALKHKLRYCQTLLPKIALSLKSGARIENMLCEYSFLGIGWLDALASAVETINEHLDCRSKKWALLVDELEIVPEELLKLIAAPLRSTCGNLIFKYSISPTGTKSEIISSLETSDPTPENDFRIIRLWHTDRDQIRVFASQLLNSALMARKLIPSNHGISDALDWSKNAEQDIVAEGKLSLEQKKQQFEELRKKDSSFRKFIESKKILINELSTSDETPAGPLIRKISPLVYFRNYVLKSWEEGLEKQPRRTKLSSQPYSGYPNLLDLTEGNPRWILNLADTLAAECSSRSASLSQPGVQHAAIDSFARRFMSMLKVYPVGTNASKNITIFGFIEALATHLNQRIYDRQFTADPSLSFSVDKFAATYYGDIIETCIHLGALVIIDPVSSDDSSLLLGGKALEGRKLRICYRLAPIFFLPLRANKQIMLSSVFKKNEGQLQLTPNSNTPESLSRTPLAEQTIDQLDLF